MSRVFIERFAGADEMRAALKEALAWIDVQRIIPPNSRVFIKPNLTWRTPTPGVTVTPSFIRAVVESLLPLTRNITIGESEGGQACFQAEDAFETHGLYSLATDYGVKVVNLSKGKHERAETTVRGKKEAIDLPSLLLHDIDVFIT